VHTVYSRPLACCTHCTSHPHTDWNFSTSQCTRKSDSMFIRRCHVEGFASCCVMYHVSRRCGFRSRRGDQCGCSKQTAGNIQCARGEVVLTCVYCVVWAINYPGYVGGLARGVHHKRNIVVRLCNHRCSGKPMRITHSLCESVASVIKHTLLMRLNIICGQFGCTLISHIISNTAQISKKKNLVKIKCTI